MSLIRRFVFMISVAVLTSGCGVKGDPEPPGTPVQIGRGRPTYKGLAEKETAETPPESAEDENRKKEKGAR